MEIHDRMRILIEELQLSSSQFADMLKIQRSAVSHLLSGRNKPSIVILEKIINEFPNINVDWLITGKGNILRTNKSVPVQQEIFPENEDIKDESQIASKEVKKYEDFNNPIEKIILIFRNKQFEIIYPKQESNGNI